MSRFLWFTVYMYTKCVSHATLLLVELIELNNQIFKIILQKHILIGPMPSILTTLSISPNLCVGYFIGCEMTDNFYRV